jgi:hypothetical protein
MTGKRRFRRNWYLLIHQLPPEPLYLRAKIRQRLARVGAVALKNAVYALPVREECLEDFQWIEEEAASGGGEAYICEAEFLEKKLEEELVARSRGERDAEYAELAGDIRDLKTSGGTDLPAQTARLRKKFDEISRIDFFDASGRKRVARLLAELERPAARRGAHGAREALVGRTWATRKGIHIDRIASAWLIRRFIDPKAAFRFIDPKETARAGELRFDMVGGDFSHEGDRCTFETLLVRSGLADRALNEVAQIVHDIDLKDEKFGRVEAAGVERLITGLVLAHPEDEARLDIGLSLFDQLYQSFRRQKPALSKEAKK